MAPPVPSQLARPSLGFTRLAQLGPRLAAGSLFARSGRSANIISGLASRRACQQTRSGRSANIISTGASAALKAVAIPANVRYSATAMTRVSGLMLSLEVILLALPGLPGASAD
jgi:hypothetical protein